MENCLLSGGRQCIQHSQVSHFGKGDGRKQGPHNQRPLLVYLWDAIKVALIY